MLSDAKARRLRAGTKPVPVGGVPGIYLVVGRVDGCGKFIFRYVSPTTGKRRDMGLGNYPDVSLAAVRRAALEARLLIGDRIDPIDHRRQQLSGQDAPFEIPAFEEAARRVHAELAPSYRNTKHAAQWLTTLETYVFPIIGARQVNELTPADFAEVLRPIWLTRCETASRVRQRMDRVMNWCAAHGFVSASPLSAVELILPRQPKSRERVEHFPAVPWRELPQVVAKLFAGRDLSAARHALLFTILTAARSGEVRKLTWSELDLDQAIWSVPAPRMKGYKPHRVPLSPEAISILRARLPHRGPKGYVFTNRPDSPLSDMTLTKILRDHKIASDTPNRFATVHGMRSSFRDWASENGYSRDMAERAVAHTIKNQTEAAYHRTDLLEARRAMMAEWGAYVTSGIGG